jgi:hypothetical protein
MKLTTGTVVRGKVEVRDSGLDEGERVMVLSLQAEEPAQLTPEEEEELAASLDEIRRGEYVLGEDLLQELRQLAGR